MAGSEQYVGREDLVSTFVYLGLLPVAFEDLAAVAAGPAPRISFKNQTHTRIPLPLVKVGDTTLCPEKRRIIAAEMQL